MPRVYHSPHEVHTDEAAALLGVTRRTIHRWIDEGRLSYPLTRSDILRRQPQKRPRGPQRNPTARRYTHGRHAFEKAKGGDGR